MRLRKSVGWGVIGLGALLATIWLIDFDRRGPSDPSARHGSDAPAATMDRDSIDGWAIRSGRPEVRSGPQHEWVEASDHPVVLERSPWQLELDPESRITWAGGEPRVVAGRATLTVIDPDGVPVDDGRLAVGSVLEFSHDDPPGWYLVDSPQRRFGWATLDVRGTSALPPPTSPDPPTAVSGSPGAGTGAQGTGRGRVVDAATGEPIVEARVLLTFTQGTDGYPALDDPAARQFAITDANGSFPIPRYEPTLARLRLHLQVEHRDYLVTTRVLSGPRDRLGDYPVPEIKARRGFTREHRFYDFHGRALASAPVLIERVVPDDVSPADSLRGEAELAARSEVVYTDDDGIVRLADGWRRVTQLLEPDLIPWEPRLDATPGWLTRERSRFAPLADHREPELHVYIVAPVPNTLLLIDRGRQALVDLLVEVEIPAEGRRFLTTTDDSGVLSFGLDERARAGERTLVRLRTLSPELFDERQELSLPDPEPTVQLSRHVSPRIRLRLVSDDDDRPVFAEQFRSNGDLTLVSRDAAGFVTLAGRVPRGQSRFEIAVRDHLPVSVEVPVTTRPDPWVDLGEVRLERGLSVELRWPEGLVESVPGTDDSLELTVVDPELFQPTRAGVEPREGTWTYRLDTDSGSRVRVHGLRNGHRYRYSVRGETIQPQDDEFVVSPTVVSQGIDIILRRSNERLVQVGGRVGAADLEAWLRDGRGQFRVIERYYFGQPDDPHVAASYLLPLDGVFGSRRVQPLAQRAEVVIQSLGFGYGLGRSGPENVVLQERIDFGAVRLGESRTRRLHFYRPGWGPVPPPTGVYVIAERDRNHELVQRFDEGATLLVRHLLPGRYQLHWTEPSGRRSSASFEVGSELGLENILVPRPDYAGREILLSVVDPKGEPVSAAVTARPGSFGASGERAESGSIVAGRLLAPGVFAVELTGDDRHLIAIEPVGRPVSTTLLPVELELSPPSAQPGRPTWSNEPIELVRAASLEARVRDVNGALFRGDLAIEWNPESVVVGDATEYRRRDGRPFVATLERGDLEAVGLPPGSRSIAFRALRSSGSTRLSLSLEVGQNRVGEIHLEERRKLRGIVLLPDGTPAEGATVSLVPLDQASRLPLARPAQIDATYAARTDAGGFFEIDGVPLDLDSPRALVARKQDWLDAIESPVDLRAVDRVLLLGYGNELAIDVGYRRGTSDDYRFLLTFEPFGSGTGRRRVEFGPAKVLGELAPTPAGSSPQRFPNVAPGRYTVSWELRDGHPDAMPVRRSTTIGEGDHVAISARLDAEFESGHARFLGQSVSDGWVVITDDPGDPERQFWSRVADSRFHGPVPDGSTKLFATVVPRRDPIPTVDFATGQGRPAPIERRRGELSIDTVAYDLELVFEDDFYTPRPYHFTWPRFEWRFGEWREVEGTPRPIPGRVLRYSLLPPGLWRYRIDESLRQGWTSQRTIDLRENLELRVVR